jgi:hypothetical protein
MTVERSVVMPVQCPRCKTKQKVHVAARLGPTLKADERIQLIQCDLQFNVSVMDKIRRAVCGVGWRSTSFS